MANSDEVLIIGGGFAGLAAGVALAAAGRRVRLLEQKTYLGGRARSFVDPRSGAVVDNGQHLVMGCYHSTAHFLSTIGTLDRVAFQRSLTLPFVEAGRGVTRLECPRLRAPWHLIFGVLGSDCFTSAEKLEVCSLGRRLSLRSAGSFAANGEDVENSGLSVDGWLEKLGQSERLRRNFWDLLSIAAMNEDPRVASAALLERVLRLALFQSAEDSRLGIPRVGLSDCYTEAARDFILARGGAVGTDRSVERLTFRSQTGEASSQVVCDGMVLSRGERIQAHSVVSAVPWHVFLTLLPEEVVHGEPFFSKIRGLRDAPIISICLWLDRPVTDLEFAGLRGTTVQWLFNKGQALGPDGQMVSLVLSGARGHVDRSKEELIAVALGDLKRLFPAASRAKLVRSLVIKERQATFSPSVDAEACRPSACTPIRGLYLAGDWTDTGLPATIEGAVKSGYTAAEKILSEV